MRPSTKLQQNGTPSDEKENVSSSTGDKIATPTSGRKRAPESQRQTIEGAASPETQSIVAAEMRDAAGPACHSYPPH